MRKGKFIVLFLVVMTGFFYGQEKIVFKEGTDFEEKLAANNVFFKSCRDFEIEPENNLVYFLDRTYGQIFIVELSSGKLLKTISSKGEGPGQLKLPNSLRVRNKMVFVLDSGLNSIKIFGLEGKLISEFRLKSALMGRRNIDVNDKNEIFVGRVDYTNKTMVSVYDINGNEKRSLIRYEGEDSRDKARTKKSSYQYLIKLDKKGNILLLFYMLRKLAKYTGNGELVWEKKIENEILDQFPEDDFVKGRGRTISKRWYIFNMDVLENNDVVVGHAGGGCIFDENGEYKSLLYVKRWIESEQKTFNVNLHTFKIRDNVLMNVLLRGKSIYHYKFLEVKK